MLARTDVDAMKEFILEMMNHVHNIEADLNYHQAILDGTWSNSPRILSQALDRARIIHKDEILRDVELKLDGC